MLGLQTNRFKLLDSIDLRSLLGRMLQSAVDKLQPFPNSTANLYLGLVQCCTWSSYQNQTGSEQPLTTMEEHIELEGKILAVLAGTMFRVELNNKHQVLAHVSGKMRKNFVRLTIGDRVKMKMSPYDLNKARIVFRLN